MIREAIAQGLKYHGVKVQVAAEALGVGSDHVSNYLRGKKGMSSSNIEQLAELAKLTVGISPRK